MGNVASKLAYTYKAVKDIRQALTDKGKNALSVPLIKIGDMIRSLPVSTSKVLYTTDFTVSSNKQIDLGFNAYESHSFPVPRLASYSELSYTPIVQEDSDITS